MPEQEPRSTEPRVRVSYWLLLGDFLCYVALFLAVVIWKRDARCVLGGIIAVPSFVLWFMAKLHLGRSFTVKAEARELVKHGLYSKVRNPIYFFSTLAMVGIGVCLRSWYFYAYLVFVAAGQYWRIRREEAVLREKFGPAYLDYRRRTWF